jgi:hypothetical protein
LRTAILLYLVWTCKSVLVAEGGDGRCLLLRQERVEEGEYRQAVQESETKSISGTVGRGSLASVNGKPRPL